MGRQFTADYFEHPDVRGVSVSLEAVFFPMALPPPGDFKPDTSDINQRSLGKHQL